MRDTAERPAPRSVEDAASRPQEADVWWGGYAGRAMLPSFGVCLLITVSIVVLTTYLWGEELVRASVARWLTYHLNVALWLVQVVRWSYRMAGYEYRLTTQRIFCLRGWLSPSPLPVALADVRDVQVRQTGMERWLGVGEVVVEAKDRAEPLALVGVKQPEQVATIIRTQMKSAREPRTDATGLPKVE